MPPWASGPRISYWPPTRSPAVRLGALVTKSNGVRQLLQKPVTRPGRSSTVRPTGRPHDEQNRSSSGTSPSAAAILSADMTAAAGSPTSVGATVTRPSPRPEREVPVRLDRVVRRDDPLTRRDVPGALGAAIDGVAAEPGSGGARLGRGRARCRGCRPCRRCRSSRRRRSCRRSRARRRHPSGTRSHRAAPARRSVCPTAPAQQVRRPYRRCRSSRRRRPCRHSPLRCMRSSVSCPGSRAGGAWGAEHA